MNGYILAVDQSTSATKAFAIGKNGIAAERSEAHRQAFPREGWVEFDADEVYENLLKCLDDMADIAAFDALAITNQRESAVLWDAETLKPVCPAVSWQCQRGKSIAGALAANAEYVRKTTGMELSCAYSAAKMAWMLENTGRRSGVRLGTMDAYLINRLTRGERFMTDVSNAGRTQLMNLKTLDWDEELLRMFGIDRRLLPDIAMSDADFGAVREGRLAGLPIAAAIGDSQASLYAQGALKRGDMKVSYGTGSSVMMQLGASPAPAKGLTSTPAWGFSGKVDYVLEGNITHSGDTFSWLRDEIGLFSDMDEFSRLASSVPDAGGVQLVPALTGLGAPYFDTGARGMLCGMSRGTTKAHIARAAMEAVCFQISDCVNAMRGETDIRCLLADGGGTGNAEMMRFQADILGIPVKVYGEKDGSALGAAIIAGVKTGLFSDFAEASRALAPCAVYEPDMSGAERLKRLGDWRRAVERARFRPL